jgi:hypothetical protein
MSLSLYGFKTATIDELKQNGFKEWFEVGNE